MHSTSIDLPPGFGRLRRSPHLQIIAAEDDGYDAARMPWNTAYEHRPLAIARPSSVAGVVEVVDFARTTGYTLAIQAAGHGPAAEADGGILLDVSALDHVQVDPQRRRAVIGGGAKWQAVLEAASPHGLAPLLGSSPDVGAVGYTLGGGMGWLYRRYGTCAESALRFEVVTATGRVLEVSAEHEAGLFWALRGAGHGHLGVVTEMEIELVPVTEVYGGNLFYPAEVASEVMRRWREWIAHLPDSMTSSVVLMNFPPFDEIPVEVRGTSFAIVRGAHVGPTAEAEQMLAFWRDWQAPMIDAFGPMPFDRIAEVSQDPVDPLPAEATGLWLRALSDASIDELVGATFAEGGPPLFIFTELRHAARSAVPAAGDLGELTREGATMLLEMVALAPTGDVQAAARAAIDQVSRAISSDLTGRHYLNFVEGNKRRHGAEMAFGRVAAQRLAAVKQHFDPDHLFDHGLDVASTLR